MLITRLTPSHAAAAARLHMAGQPGTFLTRLGPEVLTVLYRTLPVSQAGFGFVALAREGGTDEAVGFVSATTSVAGLFFEMGTRRLGQLLPPLLAGYIRQPSLAVRSVQTAAYPLLVHVDEGPQPAAELLSIMVVPEQRSRGVGALLMQALLYDCRQRGMAQLTVTVDTGNMGAARFYARHGFAPMRSFTMYGRTMTMFARTT
jgi:ribosomal protein S18 acetylase RimI-like enzyme